MRPLSSAVTMARTGFCDTKPLLDLHKKVCSRDPVLNICDILLKSTVKMKHGNFFSFHASFLFCIKPWCAYSNAVRIWASWWRSEKGKVTFTSLITFLCYCTPLSSHSNIIRWVWNFFFFLLHCSHLSQSLQVSVIRLIVFTCHESMWL